MRTVIIALSAALALACGGSTADVDEEPASEPAVAPTAGAEQVPEAWPAWADIPEEDRGRYMAEVVVPRMNEVFGGFASEHLPSSVDCATCHGENAREVGFRMPNGLHPLNPQEIPAMFSADDAEMARVAQFMAGPVEHTMAELLGVAPYDPETGEGFGCMGCHAMAE